MASRLFSSYLLLFLLIGCSVNEDKIDYESEFQSIVIEFENSSILNFDQDQLSDFGFVEDFINKLDKQKTTFLQEDIEAFINTKVDTSPKNYWTLKNAVDLYYQRYKESLNDRRRILNTHVFNFEKDEFIELKSREQYFRDEKAKNNYQRKIIKNELINSMLSGNDLKEAKSELKKIYTDRISSISKIREADRFTLLANNFLYQSWCLQ